MNAIILKADDKDFTGLDSKEKRERTFEALRDLIICLSQEKCLVLRLPGTREDKNEKMEVFYLLADSMAFLSYPEGSLEMIQAFERLSKELGNSKDIARAYSSLALYYSEVFPCKRT